MTEAEFAEPGTVPTPQQWINRWNSLDDATRLVWAERILAESEIAHRCFVMNHDALLDEIAHLRQEFAKARL